MYDVSLLAQSVEPTARLFRLNVILVATIILVIVFLLGAVLIRSGRLLIRRGPPQRASPPFEDVWSQYRITDEQIRAATEENPPDESAPSSAEGDEPPEPGPRDSV